MTKKKKIARYKAAFDVACDLLCGGILYGSDANTIFEEMMQEDGYVSSSSYKRYILQNLNRLTGGLYGNSKKR